MEKKDNNILKLDPSKVNIFNVGNYIKEVKHLLNYIINKERGLNNREKSLQDRESRLDLREKSLQVRESRLDLREKSLQARESELTIRENGLQDRKSDMTISENTLDGQASKTDGRTEQSSYIRINSTGDMDTDIDDFFTQLSNIYSKYGIKDMGFSTDIKEFMNTYALFQSLGEILGVLTMELASYSSEKLPYELQKCKETIEKILAKGVETCKTQNNSNYIKMIESYIRLIASQFDWILYRGGEYEYEIDEEELEYNEYQIPSAVKNFINESKDVSLFGTIEAITEAYYVLQRYKDGNVIYLPFSRNSINYMIQKGRISKQHKIQFGRKDYDEYDGRGG